MRHRIWLGQQRRLSRSAARVWLAVDNTLEEQAQWIVQAFQQCATPAMPCSPFLFNYDFGNKGTGPTDDPVPYSIIDINGAPRPAFGAVASMQK